MDLLGHLQMVAAAEADRGRGPFADPVHGQHHRLLERRGEEGARGMALMMLGEQQPVRPIEVGSVSLELPAQQVLLEQLLLEPERDGHAERRKAPGREGEIALQQPLELEEGLVVERHIIHLAQADPGRLEAIGDGRAGEARIVLPAAETLLLGGGNDQAVLDERRRAVVVESGDAEDSHAVPVPVMSDVGLEDGVDERRDGGALGQHDQPPEHRHHHENGQQPVFLADPHEEPQLFDKVAHLYSQN